MLGTLLSLAVLRPRCVGVEFTAGAKAFRFPVEQRFQPVARIVKIPLL